MTGLPQCVVLGGGRGTRLGPLTDSMPKPMVPVAGEPFVLHQLRWLAGEGVDRVLYSIGYLGHQIREAVVAAPDLGVEVVFVDEQDRRLGTAGALRLALDEDALEDDFMLVYGDSYLDVDLAAVVDGFHRSGGEALMTVCTSAASGVQANARLVGDRVDLYDKAPSPSELATMHHVDFGVSVLRRRTIADRVPPGRPIDLAVVVGELAREGALAGFEVPGPFREIGSPEGLRELRELLAAGS